MPQTIRLSRAHPVNADLLTNILGVVFVIIAIVGWASDFSVSNHLVPFTTGVILLASAYCGGACGAVRGLGVVYLLLTLASFIMPVSEAGASPDRWLILLCAIALLAIGYFDIATQRRVD